MKKKLLAVLLIALLFAAACGDGKTGEDTPPVDNGPVDEIPPEDTDPVEEEPDDTAEPEPQPTEPENPFSGELLPDEDGYRLYESTASGLAKLMEGKSFYSQVKMAAGDEPDAEGYYLRTTAAMGRDESGEVLFIQRNTAEYDEGEEEEYFACYKDGYFYRTELKTLKTRQQTPFDSSLITAKIEPFEFPKEAVIAADVYKTGGGYAIDFDFKTEIMLSALYGTPAEDFISKIVFDLREISYTVYLDEDKNFISYDLVFSGIGESDEGESYLVFTVTAELYPLEDSITFPDLDGFVTIA